MNKKLGVLILVLALVLAGCTGSDGTASETPSQSDAVAGDTQTTTPTEQSGTEATQASESAAPGEHPAVSDGAVNISQLVGGHLVVLSQSESFTVVNNRTVTYVENGSVQGRTVMINRGDIANQRHHIERRSIDSDGSVRFVETRYANATTTCVNSGEQFQCRDTGVETREIVGLIVETTSLETVAAPDFSPDGAVERNGQSLYRYSASSFRSPIEPETEGELYGDEPSLVTATLLVHPNDRIVEYSLTYQTGGDNPRTLELVYRTSELNETRVTPPQDVG